jgi:hypothetical protein
MKTNIMVTVGGFCMLVLTGTTLSIAEESKEYCKLEFWIAGSVDDVAMFDEGFTRSPPYKMSGCGLNSTKQVDDERIRNDYICSQPNTEVISAAARNYEKLLVDKDSANERENRRRKHHGLLLHDRPLMASIDDPANVLAQAQTGSPEVSFGVTAAQCLCGTSGPCSSGGMKCSKLHPSCPPC